MRLLVLLPSPLQLQGQSASRMEGPMMYSRSSRGARGIGYGCSLVALRPLQRLRGN